MQTLHGCTSIQDQDNLFGVLCTYYFYIANTFIHQQGRTEREEHIIIQWHIIKHYAQPWSLVAILQSTGWKYWLAFLRKQSTRLASTILLHLNWPVTRFIATPNIVKLKDFSSQMTWRRGPGSLLHRGLCRMFLTMTERSLMSHWIHNRSFQRLGVSPGERFFTGSNRRLHLSIIWHLLASTVTLYSLSSSVISVLVFKFQFCISVWIATYNTYTQRHYWS